MDINTLFANTRSLVQRVSSVSCVTAVRVAFRQEVPDKTNRSNFEPRNDYVRVPPKAINDIKPHPFARQANVEAISINGQFPRTLDNSPDTSSAVLGYINAELAKLDRPPLPGNWTMSLTIPQDTGQPGVFQADLNDPGHTLG